MIFEAWVPFHVWISFILILQDDAIDPLDDLEDSESDFQPEDMVDSDMSDSSGNEFVPTPPKRSKVCI